MRTTILFGHTPKELARVPMEDRVQAVDPEDDVEKVAQVAKIRPDGKLIVRAVQHDGTILSMALAPEDWHSVFDASMPDPNEWRNALPSNRADCHGMRRKRKDDDDE